MQLNKKPSALTVLSAAFFLLNITYITINIVKAANANKGKCNCKNCEKEDD